MDLHQIRKPTPLFLLCAIFTLLIGFSPSSAAAQQDAELTYRDLITEALNEYKRSNWEEARSLFQKAHKLKPSARTLRGLGMASFEARRYVQALIALKGALQDNRKPLTAEQRVEVAGLLERTKRFVGSFELRLQPTSATITVDGRDAIIHEDRLLLDPGRREVVAKAEGYETAVRQLTVDGGVSGSLELILKPQAHPGEQQTELAASQTEYSKESISESTPSDENDSLIPLLVLGTSGAVAVAGTVMLILALNDKSSVENPEEGTRLADIEAAHDRVPTFSTIGGVLLGVGIAGAAVGVVLLSVGGSPESEQSSISLRPNGIVMRGSL